MTKDLNGEILLKNRKEYYDDILKELNNSNPGLIELERWRNEEFPLILKNRYIKDEELYITLDELKKLMEWKLKKGKFRPTLKKLIAQNDSDIVIKQSKEAFQLILKFKEESLKEEEYFKIIKQSLNSLIKLRGVGPATASLVLSCLNKITKLAPPFFSDESAFVIFNSYGKDKGSIKLKYSLSEYLKYLKIIYLINEEFKYDFTQLENGAWSLYLEDEFDLKNKHKHDLDATDDKTIKPTKKVKR